MCALENLDQEICKISHGLHTVLIFTKCMNGVGNSVELRATRQKSGIQFPTKRGPICPDRLTVASVWLVAAVTQPDCEVHRPLTSICVPEYGYVHGALVVEWATMVEFPVAPCSDRYWDFSNSPFFGYLGVRTGVGWQD